MKFAIAALFGLVSAIKLDQSVVEQLHAEVQKKGMITIDLKPTEYTSERAKEAEQYSGLSQQETFSLAQSFGVPVGTNGLVQREQAVSIDMKNYKNMGYEGKFFFGNPSQELDVIFDTGSAWAWVFSGEDCTKQCPKKNPKFFRMRSREFKQNEKGGQFFQYGKGAVLGHPAEDRGCFANGEQCFKMNFLNVIKGKDLEALQGGGLIGLAPIVSKEKELKEPLNNGIPGFIAQLKNDEEYKSKFATQFSIYLSRNEAAGSAMSFGGYDLGKFAKAGTQEKDVQWADIGANEAYWTINSKASGLGSAPLSSGHQMVILDNGMSLAFAPKKSFMALVNNLYKNHNIACLPMPGAPVYPCKCSSADYDNLPDLQFNIQKNAEGEETVIRMPRQAYMKFAYQGKEEGCMLLINPWDFAGLGGQKGDEYWVLGAQFLQHYYTIYDYGEKKIGLVHSKTSQIGEKVPVREYVKETPKSGIMTDDAAGIASQEPVKGQATTDGKTVEVSIQVDNNNRGLLVTPASTGTIKL